MLSFFKGLSPVRPRGPDQAYGKNRCCRLPLGLIRTAGFLLALLAIQSCTYFPTTRLSLYQRSTTIRTPETEQEILSRASLEKSNDPAVNRIKILYLKGSPYEMGFQHGRLLQRHVRNAVYAVLTRASYLVSPEALDEVYDLAAPYIPVEEKEEMRGLAHGAGLPLRLVHRVHIIPELSEYRGRKQFGKQIQGTSCSNLAAFGRATSDGGLYQLRVLDWNRELGTQEWPVILVHQPDRGHASVTFSFAGFIGCVSGMNERHLALGEKGEGSDSPETLEGIPFVFLFRKLMREAATIEQALDIIRRSPRTCAYSYLIGDGRACRAALVFSDRLSFAVYGPDQSFMDPRSGRSYPGIPDTVYNGADKEVLFETIGTHYGRIDPGTLMEVARRAARTSNIQNVIFNPGALEAWVSHAATNRRDEAGRAANQAWFRFDFGKALSR